MLQYTLQHTATHCNTLQRTATHCNTLQRTATHCNTHDVHKPLVYTLKASVRLVSLVFSVYTKDTSVYTKGYTLVQYCTSVYRGLYT